MVVVVAEGVAVPLDGAVVVVVVVAPVVVVCVVAEVWRLLLRSWEWLWLSLWL